MTDLLPLFLNLARRRVLLVGAGPVAASKLRALLAAGADVTVVAPLIDPAIEQAGVRIERREFAPADLDGVWLAVAAATPDVNRAVAQAADARRIFVNAADDPANASAFLGGVVRRDGVTVAISTGGDAPALAGLLREAFDAVLPRRSRRVGRRKPSSAAGVAPRRCPDGRAPAAAPRGAERDLPQADRRVPRRRRRARALDQRAGGFMDVRTRGCVSLVGAGPGDPALLTRKAVAALRAADLVLYDALVDARVLRFARRGRRFYVGKRAGRHAMSQDAIHALMIRAARRGLRVVRLKGGDPFVFGRGGEEAIALRAAHVPVDVVPGISNAVAAPALAGIPVTHRGLASAFFVVGGHDVEAFAESTRGLASGGATLVILMGLARSAAIASVLIARGWPRSTPAAIIVDASLPAQQVWRGTIADLAADRVEARGDGPGTIVIGAVVSLGRRGRRAAGGSSMSVIDEPTTHGRARLSFASRGRHRRIRRDAGSLRARGDDA